LTNECQPESVWRDRETLNPGSKAGAKASQQNTEPQAFLVEEPGCRENARYVEGHVEDRSPVDSNVRD